MNQSRLARPAQQAFDDLTLLAARLCGTPVALVSLVDRDRQWFKSRRGVEVAELPREVAFCAHAILNPNEILHVPDTLLDERFAHHALVAGDPGVRFYAGAPLVTPDGHALGTLCVIDTRPHELDDGQKESLWALARQVMGHLELKRSLIQAADHLAFRIQIEQELHLSLRRFEAFMDSSPIVAFLKDEAGRFVYVNRPFLERFHLSREEVIGREGAALWPEVASVLREHDQQVLARGETVSIVESVVAPDGRAQHWQVYKFPLPRGGGDERHVAGVAVDITENKHYELQLEKSHEQLEVALAEVEKSNATDALSGLFNRRAFNDKLDEECARARRYGVPLALLMLDVDRFKSYNDSFGHPSGDELLRGVSRLLADRARASDFVARYGGEEFAIILPSTGREGAYILAERFRRAVASTLWPNRAVTMSIGVASFTTAMPDAAALLEAADKALYVAKQSGRNRTAQSPERE